MSKKKKKSFVHLCWNTDSQNIKAWIEPIRMLPLSIQMISVLILYKDCDALYRPNRSTLLLLLSSVQQRSVFSLSLFFTQTLWPHQATWFTLTKRLATSIQTPHPQSITWLGNAQSGDSCNNPTLCLPLKLPINSWVYWHHRRKEPRSLLPLSQRML